MTKLKTLSNISGLVESGDGTQHPELLAWTLFIVWYSKKLEKYNYKNWKTQRFGKWMFPSTGEVGRHLLCLVLTKS
jgi:hypothetical protein